LRGLLKLAAAIDRLSWAFGLVASVMVLTSCVISAVNATLRYSLDMSSNAWLEIQWQMFAAIFLLGAPWVLKLNEHVRVDMLYTTYSPRRKLWVDVFGITVFLLPAACLMIYLSLPWALNSMAQGERSANAGGLLIWPVKFLLPLGFLLMALQGLAELVKRIAALTGDLHLDTDYEAPLQ